MLPAVVTANLPALRQEFSRDMAELGQIVPDIATIDAMVEARNQFVKQHSMLSYEEQLQYFGIKYENFCSMVSDINGHLEYNHKRRIQADKLIAEGHKIDRYDYSVGHLNDEQISFTHAWVLLKLRREDFQPTINSWIAWLRRIGPFDQGLAEHARPGNFPEIGRTENTFIAAPTKWGKSELLKSLIWHYVRPPNNEDPQAGVIVLDPGGDLVREVARWPELSGAAELSPGGSAPDRLIYIEPNLVEGMTVGINPLDGQGLDHRGRNHVAGMIAAALGETTAELSTAMQTLVINCVTVLLNIEGSTLRDLAVMLRDPNDDKRVEPLIKAALSYPDVDIRNFFLFDFFGESYRGTKGFLRNRINNLMSVSDFAAMFGGETTVDLIDMLEDRHVILVNLAKFENEDAIQTAGRMFIAMLGSLGRRRMQLPPDTYRVPVHVFVDEVTTMVSNEMVRMLAQMRKFGVHQTLAQQVAGANFNADQKASLFVNTGCKFVGGLDPKMIDDVLNLTEKAKDLPALSKRQFWVQWPDVPGPSILNVRSDLAGMTHAVSAEEWAQWVALATGDGPEAYYRPSKPELEPADASALPAGMRPSVRVNTKRPQTTPRTVNTPKPVVIARETPSSSQTATEPD